MLARLARLSRELPYDEGNFFYEPTWDGFRCLAFVDDGTVDLRSRHERPLSRYFPEIVEALRELPTNGAVLERARCFLAGAPWRTHQ